ncbi:pkb-activating kinase-like protein [Lunasporangiospora selenospora]|uniref:non-specific serine/threonine protein kinase n=1 Tax=Lunasporangiospora selenospora TaxID=979761 RepID=A0A9P6FVN4_9FUNG|nr:pkb-activating kinase-like protein [Lunasporangiospora selenospora]
MSSATPLADLAPEPVLPHPSLPAPDSPADSLDLHANSTTLVSTSSLSPSPSTTTHLTTASAPPNKAVATATTPELNGAAAATASIVRKRTLKDYRLGRTLGEGAYSTVVAAIDHSNGRDYAIKVLDKRHIIREKKVKYVNIEKNTLYKLDHPGIVKLYSTFQDASSLYYVLELCPNGDLLTFIRRLGSFDEEGAQFYAAQILTAVDYMHSKGVIHRDLKPEKMYIKLTDFGTAKLLETSEDGAETDRANSFVGTAEYVSPELLTEKSAWQFILLAGRPPFKGTNEYQTFQKIVNLEYTFPVGFPDTAKDLVTKLLVHDANARLGANNTIDLLKQHPFFDGVQWDELWTMPAPASSVLGQETITSEDLTLIAIDPFREIGPSGSSMGNSGCNSVDTPGDGIESEDEDNTRSVENLTTTLNDMTLTNDGSVQDDLPTVAIAKRSGTESGEDLKEVFKATSRSDLSAPVTNGHSKKKSGSKHAIMSLFTSHSALKQSLAKLVGKKPKNGTSGENTVPKSGSRSATDSPAVPRRERAE